MSKPLSASVVSGEADRLMAEVIAEITDRLHAGAPVDVAEYMTRHPELADRLRPMLAALDLLAQFSSSAGSDRVSGRSVAGEQLGGTLGDFRIVREVGRGGMGIVYEAEQISLRRRVALKVLPFAATMDPRHLQRFHNEAQAAACLHHTNIVPVHFVGCERSVHFYAMQFIDGQPLSEIIRQLQSAEKKAQPKDGEKTVAYQPSADEAASTPVPAAELTPWTGEGRRSRDYYRKVAELGIQAAEALDHAHQLGIVHRDIKPANLMLDVRGNLWVTDFGLAHMQHGEASLTMTGQAVGTPRYMSPEQAMAKRVPIDHRTDVYSLGVTLYELLTLRPAFASEDRQELLRQIAFEEPNRPRRSERAIPAQLEIIVLKAMEKRPQDRYATAEELADDLERWLKHEPIRARRPTLLQRASKLVQRHKTASAASVVVSLIALMLAGYVSWTLHDRALRREASEKVVLAALKESQDWQQQRRLPEAMSAARRAYGVLAGSDADEALRQRVRARLADLELLERLEHVHEESSNVNDLGMTGEKSDELYGQTFREGGLDVETLPVEEAAECIRRSTVAVELAAVLDDWALIRREIRGAGDSSWKDLLRIARAADSDSWRTRIREAFERWDQKALLAVASSEEVFGLSPLTLVILGSLLPKDKETHGQVEAFLREAQRRHPSDFRLNLSLLSHYHVTIQPPQLEESHRFAALVVALRPDSAAAHVSLGYVLNSKGKLDEAIAEHRQAIRLKKDYLTAHNALAGALLWKGQLDEAIAVCHKAIRISKDYASIHATLGSALFHKRQLDEAIAELREAIRLKKDFLEAHNTLGWVLVKKGQLDEAIAEFREAIRIRKDFFLPHYSLGRALVAKGQLDEAIAEYRESIRLREDFAWAHSYLGGAFEQQGRFTEALAYRRRGHELGSKDRQWPDPSAQWVRNCERFVELDGKLPAILSGRKQPADNAERIALAQFCQLPGKQLYLAAKSFYSAAFAEEPKLADDLNAQHRYNAACAAALAGCGQGKDADKIDVKERARLRQQALDWLRADLKAHRQAVEKTAAKAGPEIAQRMQHWLQDEDFAGVRGAESLSKLPEAERKEWQQLWREVEALRQRAAQPSKTTSSARP